MISFEYKGISAGKYVEGDIEALNSDEAAYKLKEKKVIITKITQIKKRKKGKVKKEKSSSIFGNRVRAKDVLIFSNSLPQC